MSNKYIICCDFDGVLHSYTSGWKGPTVIPDPPVAGALDWLIAITKDDRFELAVYSSRSKEHGGVSAMFGWLHTHLVDHFERTHSADRMNARLMSESVLERLKFPTQKPAASMTIDDRAFHFQGVFPTVEWLLAFQPWTKIKDDRRWAVPRPSASRIAQIREAFEDDFGGATDTVHLDSKDAAIGDLLAEIDHLKGSLRG